MPKCPICDAESKPRAENKLFPFCSPRCKTIDLGNWLNESYRVPSECQSDEHDSDDEDASPKGDMRH